MRDAKLEEKVILRAARIARLALLVLVRQYSRNHPTASALLLLVCCELISSGVLNFFIRDATERSDGHIYALVGRESLVELCNVAFTNFPLCVLFTPKWNELTVAKLFAQV